MDYKQRYNAAHKQWFSVKYPEAFASGFYSPPKMPQVAKANGLTRFIVNFIDWSGYHANRISSAGRYVEGKGFISSTTKKGTADIDATIKGRSLKIEVKIGKDRASVDQLKIQAKVRQAGGCYEFISTPDQFFELYDKFIL